MTGPEAIAATERLLQQIGQLTMCEKCEKRPATVLHKFYEGRDDLYCSRCSSKRDPECGRVPLSDDPVYGALLECADVLSTLREAFEALMWHIVQDQR